MLCWIGALGMFDFILIDCMELANQFPYNAIGGFGLGLAFGMLICGILFTSKYGDKLKVAKKKALARLCGKGTSEA